MKILYCIAGTCHHGGMERVLANKANWLVQHNQQVTVVTTDQQGLPPYFPLDARIRCIDLHIGYEDNNGKSVWNKLFHYPFKQWKHRERLSKVLKRERPDVTVSMCCNDADFITRIKDGSPKVLEIHFSKFKRLQYGRTGLWGVIDRWRSLQDEKMVRRFDKFVVLTEEDKANWGNLRNIEVIPNACATFPSETANLDSKRVVAVGRYCYQKGFERLIEAWDLINERFPDWELDIVGDGEEREHLQSLICKRQLQKSVFLQRPTKDMESVYKGAALLAVSSRYEGLPMVMIEAQAYGLPIVAFACQCGPRDIVTENETGYLVPEGDICGLARQMARLMSDIGLRRSMGKKAKEAANRYREDKVMAEWMQLFESLT